MGTAGHSISIGVSSCEQIVPDPEFMVDCFSNSLDELEKSLELTNSPQIAEQLDATAAIDEQRASDRIDIRARVDSITAFRKASLALDKAIESLEGSKEQ